MINIEDFSHVEFTETMKLLVKVAKKKNIDPLEYLSEITGISFFTEARNEEYDAWNGFAQEIKSKGYEFDTRDPDGPALNILHNDKVSARVFENQVGYFLFSEPVALFTISEMFKYYFYGHGSSPYQNYWDWLSLHDKRKIENSIFDKKNGIFYWREVVNLDEEKTLKGPPVFFVRNQYIRDGYYLHKFAMADSYLFLWDEECGKKLTHTVSLITKGPKRLESLLELYEKRKNMEIMLRKNSK